MIQIYLLISSCLLVGISRSQAGAGANNVGLGGMFGNPTGQFLQTTSGNAAKLVSTKSISNLQLTKWDMKTKLQNTKLTAKSMKNCFGFPVTFPPINIIITTGPSNTTGGTPDVRGTSPTA